MRGEGKGPRSQQIWGMCAALPLMCFFDSVPRLCSGNPSTLLPLHSIAPLRLLFA
jgi:hypothetical protein